MSLESNPSSVWSIKRRVRLLIVTRVQSKVESSSFRSTIHTEVLPAAHVLTHDVLPGKLIGREGEGGSADAKAYRLLLGTFASGEGSFDARRKSL